MMRLKAETMETSNPDVRLVKPDIERDAPLGVQWLQGDMGRSTLSLMGVADKDIKPTTLDEERQRVRDFIKKDDQINWMIQYQGQVVGTIWVDLTANEHVPSPAIHIMIGDQNVRGKGVGLSAATAVVGYLEEQGNKALYSRFLTKNSGAKGLLQKLSFTELGEPYVDGDNLEWQNVVRKSKDNDSKA